MKKIILIIPLVLASCFAMAQHDHGSGGHGNTSNTTPNKVAPHRGKISNADKYKVEMVTDLFLKKDQLTFYVYKSNLKPLENKEISGTVTIHYNDQEIESKLNAKGEYSFTAQLTSSTAFHCVVELLIKGKVVKAEFMHEGITSE